MMEGDQELQGHPNNPHNHYAHDHPSSSRSRSCSGSRSHYLSLSSSSLLSSQPNSSPTTTITTSIDALEGLHYSFLFEDDFNGLLEDIDSTESDNSTLLHLAVSFGQLNFIDFMLRQRIGQLQRQSEVRNSKGDLPLHVAARSCQLEAVKRLVSFAESQGRLSIILESKNNEQNTALHIALENHHEEMANFLFNKCQNTFYYLNSHKFSPLYLAIKAKFWDLVSSMLSVDATDEAENHLKQPHGESVVHAVIVAKRKDVLEKMVDKYRELLYKARDELGRSPLSYAAYTGFLEGVKYIITNPDFPNEAYKKDDQEGLFPIHWACAGGNIKVVNEFFSHYPEQTRWLLNNKRQNILHVAAEFGKADVVKYILQHRELEKMINMKDEDGNTPLHLGCKGKHPRVVYLFTWDKTVNLTAQNKAGMTALDIAENYGDIPSFDERLTWLSLKSAGVPTAPILYRPDFTNMNAEGGIGSNNNPQTVEQKNNTTNELVVLDQEGNIVQQHPKKKHKIKYKERINTLLVVSILVATVTFASGFTVPGGYRQENPNEGMAVLAHKCAFQVFVITNTIALYSSILAAVTLIWAHLDDLSLVLVSLDFALPLLGTSLAMMTVAFTAGLYVVLHNVISWLGILVLVMGGVFLGALFMFFIPLCLPTSCIWNSFLRYVFHIPFALMLLASHKGKNKFDYY